MIICFASLQSKFKKNVIYFRIFFFSSAFTQRAIRIISCIHHADKKGQKHEKDTAKKKEHTIQKYNKHYSKNNGKRELGDYINHAGQLLLSRGYLETAIKTENKMFFDDSIVKDILNTMWYGTDQFDFRTVC